MTILEEAAAVITGPRREAYGDAKESFARIAAVWISILKHPVSGREVALCMAGLKLCRESNAHHRDNLVDAAGYLALIEQSEL